MLGAVLVVAFGCMFGGKPVTHGRVVFASVAYGIFFAATYSALGLGIGEAGRAVQVAGVLKGQLQPAGLTAAPQR